MNTHTETQHTPGPWGVQQYTTHTGFSIWAVDRGCIAERWYDSEQSPPYGSEIKANAYLIAAAPDILEALCALLEWCGIPDGHPAQPIRDKARAAIAKATGGQP